MTFAALTDVRAPHLAGPILLAAIAGCLGAPPSGPSVFPADAGRADWWIDASALPIDPTTTILNGFIREAACASGLSPQGRILGPRIEYRPDAIIVTYRVREIGGDYPGNPSHPIMISLAEPVGFRRVLDGGVDPPRDASIDPRSP